MVRSLFSVCTLVRTALLITAVGCGSGGGGGAAGEDQPEYIRVLHAAPDAGPLSLVIDELVQVSDLRYGEATPFIDAEEGERRIRIKSEEDALPLVDTKQTVAAGKSYTFLLFEEANSDKVQFTAVEEKFEEPGAEQLNIRLLNLAPGQATVDFYITKPGRDIDDVDPAASGVAFKSYSSYLEVDSGEYRIKVTKPGSEKILLDTGLLSLAAGQSLTIALYEKEGGGTPLSYTVLSDPLP